MYVYSSWENLVSVTAPASVASGSLPALNVQGGMICSASGFVSGVGADGNAFSNVPVQTGNAPLLLRARFITQFTGTGLFIIVRT